MAILTGAGINECPTNGDLGPCAYLAERQLQVSSALKLTTAERDLLPNLKNGDFIYNTTTLRFEFYQNGAWVFYTATPV